MEVGERGQVEGLAADRDEHVVDVGVVGPRGDLTGREDVLGRALESVHDQ